MDQVIPEFSLEYMRRIIFFYALNNCLILYYSDAYSKLSEATVVKIIKLESHFFFR